MCFSLHSLINTARQSWSLSFYITRRKKVLGIWMTSTQIFWEFEGLTPPNRFSPETELVTDFLFLLLMSTSLSWTSLFLKGKEKFPLLSSHVRTLRSFSWIHTLTKQSFSIVNGTACVVSNIRLLSMGIQCRLYFCRTHLKYEDKNKPTKCTN